MASTNHDGPAVSSYITTHMGSVATQANLRRLYSLDHRVPTQPFSTTPAVYIHFLEAYASTLERELDNREDHYEETRNQYESLLDEQQRAYQRWIHELEGKGCTCHPNNDSSSNHQGRTGVATRMVHNLIDWK